MSNKIDSLLRPAAPAPVRPVSRSRDDSNPLIESGKSRDSVVVTGDARVLQQLEQRVQADSGIDETKVAETRRILALGLYSADPQAIAAKLMHVEWSLSPHR
ncbi:MAG: flagellar biosynthesis anti-sigma factor FlgM [Panacagrimonas sp.]